MSIQMMPESTAKWDNLSLNSELTPSQLNQIATELDLVAIALRAIAQIGPAEIGQTAQDLQLSSIVPSWLDSWSFRQPTTPQPINLEQIRAIVSIVTHLAQKHQTLLRQHVNYWQQTIDDHQLPLQSPSLADYISRFLTIYQDRLGNQADLSMEMLSAAALKLLVELFFYSSPHGERRLGNGLLQRFHLAVTSAA